MTKDYFKREIITDLTVWDLNSNWVIIRAKSKSKLEKKIHRKARRKLKKSLDNYLKAWYT